MGRIQPGLHLIKQNKFISVLHGVFAIGFATLLHAQLSPSGGADAKKELIGTWEGKMVDSDGSEHGRIKLEIAADKIIATNPQGERVMGAGTWQIGGAGKLRHIDAKGTDGQFQGKGYAGIFSIEGKTLKWCSANDNPRSKRPTQLKTDVKQGQFLMILEKK